MAPRRAVPQAQGASAVCWYSSPTHCTAANQQQQHVKGMPPEREAASTLHGQKSGLFNGDGPSEDLMGCCDERMLSPSTVLRVVPLDAFDSITSGTGPRHCSTFAAGEAAPGGAKQQHGQNTVHQNQRHWERPSDAQGTPPPLSPWACIPNVDEAPLAQAAQQGGFFGPLPDGLLPLKGPSQGATSPVWGLSQGATSPVKTHSPEGILPTILEGDGSDLSHPTLAAAAPSPFSHPPLPRSGARFLRSCSEPRVHRAYSPQGRLRPSEPLSSQLSPTLTALLSVLSESDSPGDGAGSAGTSRAGLNIVGSHSNSNSDSVNSARVDSCGKAHGRPMGPYRELEVSPALSALMAILSYENDQDSPSEGSCHRGIPANRSMHEVSELEASLRELDMEASSPGRRLTRQSSLDPGVGFFLRGESKSSYNRRGSKDPSPTGSLHASPTHSPSTSPCHSPSVSPTRARPPSSLHSTPSPVLLRRITSNRALAVRECWKAGPMRRDVAESGGLRSVTEIIEQEGTAAFYRGFQAHNGGASPISPARSKRSRR